MFEIRHYRDTDCEKVAKLFVDTVTKVNCSDYSPEQITAWISAVQDLEKWKNSFSNHISVVAVDNGVIVGFGDMDIDRAYLDRLYVSTGYQSQGVGTAICDYLESYSKSSLIEVHSSITARTFFEKRGYVLIKEQYVRRKNVLLKNFVMVKNIE